MQDRQRRRVANAMVLDEPMFLALVVFDRVDEHFERHISQRSARHDDEIFAFDLFRDRIEPTCERFLPLNPRVRIAFDRPFLGQGDHLFVDLFFSRQFVDRDAGGFVVPLARRTTR